MNTVKSAKAAPLDLIISVGRYEDKGDGQLIMRQVKVRENNGSADARFQLKYDMSESRYKENEE